MLPKGIVAPVQLGPIGGGGNRQAHQNIHGIIMHINRQRLNAYQEQSTKRMGLYKIVYIQIRKAA